MSEDDSKKFSDYLSDVNPLPEDNKIRHPKRKNTPQIMKTIPVEQSSQHFSRCIDSVEPNAYLWFHRDGVQPNTLKRLRQGKLAVTASLDLHGMTVDEAEQAVQQFLLTSQKNHHKVIKFISGKGLMSAPGSLTLKSHLNAWLPQCPQVLAYCSCTPGDGGRGAVYLLLKS